MTTDSAAIARSHARTYILAGALCGSFVCLAVLPAWCVYAWATAFAAVVFWRVQQISRDAGVESRKGGRWIVAGVVLAGALALLALLAGDFGKMVSYGVWVGTVGALFTAFVYRFARRRASA